MIKRIVQDFSQSDILTGKASAVINTLAESIPDLVQTGIIPNGNGGAIMTLEYDDGIKSRWGLRMLADYTAWLREQPHEVFAMVEPRELAINYFDGVGD